MEEYSMSISPDTINNATANFDPQFTRLAVHTNDDSVVDGGSYGGSHASQDELFPGFSYDQQVRMNIYPTPPGNINAMPPAPPIATTATTPQGG